MIPRAQALSLCVVIAAGLVTAGCSGPGVAVATIQAAGLQAMAADHVSAVLLLKGWLKTMYWKNIPGAGPCEPDRHSRRFPDGSRHSWGTNSDCSVYDYWIWADGSGEGTIVFVDASVEQITWGVPVRVGDVRSVDIHQSLPDGTRFDFTNTADFGQTGTPKSKIGSAVLPDGRRMDFAFHRRSLDEDRLRLDMPDGSVLEVRIPTTSVNYAVHWPIFDPGGTGYFVGAGGDRLDFTISGAGDHWDRWTFNAPDGTAGTFNLDEDLAGGGNLTRNGSVVGAQDWDKDGDGTLCLVGIGSFDITPSAAALAYQVDQWFYNLAAMGPAPMY